jgi:hypothetical protein
MSAFAGLLVLLLLVSAVLSSNQALHQRLLHSSGNGDHACLVCALVSGQIAAAAVTLLAAFLLLLPLPVLHRLGSLAPSCSDYRLSPSRAPPRR